VAIQTSEFCVRKTGRFGQHAGVFRFGAFAEITQERFHFHYNINFLGDEFTPCTGQSSGSGPTEAGSAHARELMGRLSNCFLPHISYDEITDYCSSGIMYNLRTQPLTAVEIDAGLLCLRKNGGSRMSILSRAKCRRSQFHSFRMSFIGLLCAACSSATTYSGQVDQFASATSTTQAAFDTLEEQARASQQELNINVAMATGAAVIVDPSCGADTANSNCMVSMQEPNKAPRPLTSTLETPNALQLMQRVTDYAGGLQKLTKSEDIAALNDSITGLNTAINGLAKEVAVASGATDITATLGPVETTVAFIGMSYLEERRAQAFREAVIRASNPVSGAADILGREAVQLKKIVLNADSEILNFKSLAVARIRKNNPTDFGSQRDAITGLMDDGAAIDQIAATDPAEPFEKMKEAHAALVAAVQKPGISIAEVSEKAQAFYNAARTLYNAIQASRKD
jgi:hypothetical protein